MRLLREAAPRFGTVFTTQAVAHALQNSKTVCICFDPHQNAALFGFLVFQRPKQLATTSPHCA